MGNLAKINLKVPQGGISPLCCNSECVFHSFSSPRVHSQFRCHLMETDKSSAARPVLKIWPFIDRRCNLWIKHRWTLNLTTHVIAQPPGGQIIGLSPGSVPKSLRRDRGAFRQAPSSLQRSYFPRSSVKNSHYAASLESFQCWSCRCCSLTCSSGASGRTSAQAEQQRPEMIRTRQTSLPFSSHAIRAAVKVTGTLCLSIPLSGCFTWVR